MDLVGECDWRGRNFRHGDKPQFNRQSAIGPTDFSDIAALRLVRPSSARSFAYKRQVAPQYKKQR